ncbi:MAG: ABC transporter permease, partial [bacterium]
MIFILYAFSLDIYVASQGFNLIPEMISISVQDEDRSSASRELVSRIQPPAFRPPKLLDDRQAIDFELNESRSVLSLIIPSGFERDLHRGSASLQVLVDGTQSAAAYLSSAYMSHTILAFSESFLRKQSASGMAVPITTVEAESRILFNPATRDDYFEAINEFFMVITLIGMILPSALLIREREYGTLEQIMISPVSIHIFLISKIAIATAFLVFASWLCYEGTIKLWLGIPVKGTAAEFLVLSSLYALATSGLSLIIASVARRFSQIGML